MIHTCINTATTTTGEPVQACRACQAQPYAVRANNIAVANASSPRETTPRTDEELVDDFARAVFAWDARLDETSTALDATRSALLQRMAEKDAGIARLKADLFERSPCAHGLVPRGMCLICSLNEQKVTR